MAIDHRIIQSIGVKNNAGVLDIFNKAMNYGKEQQIQQQGIDLNQQRIDTGRINLDNLGQAQDEYNSPNAKADRGQQETFKISQNYAKSVKPFINNPQALLPELQRQRAMLASAGVDQAILDGIDGDIQQAQTPQGLAELAGEIDGILQIGAGGANKSLSQREFENNIGLVKADPELKTVEGKSAAIALGLKAKASLTGEERKALDSELGTAVANQLVKEATAVEQGTETGRQAIESKRIQIDETKIANEEKRQDAINTKNTRRAEANNAAGQVDALLKDDYFANAFGKVVANTPDIAKSQESIDAIAILDQVRGLVTLESRQKLKGQGTITDSEAKTLEQSATILSNPLISDDVARKELRRIKRVFEDASDRNRLKKETASPAKANKSGGKLMIDSNGNRAIVYPDGTFEEQ